MSSRTIVYFAHPLRGATPEETAANRAAASALVARACKRFPVAPVCAWIHLSNEWTEEEGRALGLEIDCDLIERCDEIWAIGTVRPVSEGMRVELVHAEKLSIPGRDMRGYLFDGAEDEEFVRPPQAPGDIGTFDGPIVLPKGALTLEQIRDSNIYWTIPDAAHPKTNPAPPPVFCEPDHGED